MWIAIYIAQSRKKADKIEKILIEEGMLVKLRSISKKIGERDGCYEVLVPEGEASDARDIMYEAGY